MKTYLRGYRISEKDVWNALDCWLGSQAGKKHGHKIPGLYGSRQGLVSEIHSQIEGRCLTFEPIRYFNRKEPTNGKVRRLGIESIKQQVCGYLVVKLLEPMFFAKIGYFQAASIPGKGQAWLLKRVERFKDGTKWVISADIVKAYPSTKPKVVMRLYRKYCGSADVLYVCAMQLASYDNQLSIGSYFSLFSEHLVLSEIYHAIESMGKVRRGKRVGLVSHQAWFMDNLWLFGNSRRDIETAMRMVESLSADYGLTWHEWQAVRTSETLDCLGWRIKERATVLRRGLYIRLSRAYRRMSRAPCLRRAFRCISYWGFLSKSGCRRFMVDVRATFDRSRSYVSESRRLT